MLRLISYTPLVLAYVLSCAALGAFVDVGPQEESGITPLGNTIVTGAVGVMTAVKNIDLGGIRVASANGTDWKPSIITSWPSEDRKPVTSTKPWPGQIQKAESPQAQVPASSPGTVPAEERKTEPTQAEPTYVQMFVSRRARARVARARQYVQRHSRSVAMRRAPVVRAKDCSLSFLQGMALDQAVGAVTGLVPIPEPGSSAAFAVVNVMARAAIKSARGCGELTYYEACSGFLSALPVPFLGRAICDKLLAGRDDCDFIDHAYANRDTEGISDIVSVEEKRRIYWDKYCK